MIICKNKKTIFKNGFIVNFVCKKISRHLDAAALSEFTGTYKFDENTEDDPFTITLKGPRLMVSIPGNPSFPISPLARDTFEVSMIGMELIFERGDNGAVNAMVMHYQDDVTRSTKLE